MRLNIEATLFRPEQADPFFDALQSYRDEKLWLSLGNAWLELEKEHKSRTGENIPYKVVGADVPGEGSLPGRVLELFRERYLPVEVGSARSSKLPPVEPFNTKMMAFEMSQMYRKTQGPAHETKGMLIYNVPLWRPSQLHALSFLIDSYYDRKIELCLSAGKKKASLLLRKIGSSDDSDLPHVVAGCVSDEMDVFKYVSEMFPHNKDQPCVNACATNIPKHDAWNYFSKPMPLLQFASVISWKYDESKR
jgi:hypothetical protein